MATVISVHRGEDHAFSKSVVESIDLLAGLGVVDDAHSGARVRHRSRVAADPTQPNLRQVHLIHSELLDDVRAAGFTVDGGDLGENISTRGIDLLRLPVASVLAIGPDVLLSVTGLRNPCGQINGLEPGLLDQVRRSDEDGEIERLAGIMAVVIRGGRITAGDSILIGFPPEPHHRLERV